MSFLKTGMLHADRLTTVSPTYALEIQTEAQGFGLDPSSASGARRSHGILNGVDYDDWDPRTIGSSRLATRRRASTERGRTRRALLAQLGLPFSETVPLVRHGDPALVPEGDRAPLRLAPRGPRDGSRCSSSCSGPGEAAYESFFEGSRLGFPTGSRFYAGFDEELAHWIEAGADLFLMPSRYEPCGLNQMYSLRYGTVPIVRKTGGLADSVRAVRSERRARGPGSSSITSTRRARLGHRTAQSSSSRDRELRAVSC